MDARTDTTGITLATWVYLLHRNGMVPAVPAVAAACAAVDADGDAAAGALHEAVRAVLGGEDREAVAAAAAALFGDAVQAGFATGDDADLRAAALRRVTFGDSRPWLAFVADRRQGALGEHLVMVEQFTDSATLMDPNPWDDVAEERVLSVVEFLVRWELAGAWALRVA